MPRHTNIRNVIVTKQAIDIFIVLSNKISQTTALPKDAMQRACTAAFQEILRILRKEGTPLPSITGFDPALFAVAQAIHDALVQTSRAVIGGRGLVEVQIPPTEGGTSPTLDALLIHPAYPPRPAGLYENKNFPNHKSYEIEVIKLKTAGVIYQKFLQALNGLDARRIRECPACGRIFFAHRKHAVVCSPACRIKKWKNKNPVEWNAIQERYELKRARSEHHRRRT